MLILIMIMRYLIIRLTKNCIYDIINRDYSSLSEGGSCVDIGIV